MPKTNNALIEFAKNDDNFITPVIADPEKCTKTERKSASELKKQKKNKAQKEKRRKRKDAKIAICSCIKDGHIDMTELRETAAECADCL